MEDIRVEPNRLDKLWSLLDTVNSAKIYRLTIFFVGKIQLVILEGDKELLGILRSFIVEEIDCETEKIVAEGGELEFPDNNVSSTWNNKKSESTFERIRERVM